MRARVARAAGPFFVACIAGCAGRVSSEEFALLQAERLAVLDGFDLPETVEYDEREGVYWVSNMVGNPTAADGNGFLSRIDAETLEVELRRVPSGAGGELNGPKGLALHGEELFVADIDVVRTFDRRTAAALRTIDLRPFGAIALNDIDARRDGTLYLTDPRLLFDEGGASRKVGVDRIFRIAPDGTVVVEHQGDWLDQPNGIAWDRRRKRLLVAPLGGSEVLSWRQGEGWSRLPPSAGRYDGLEVLRDGGVLVSSLADGTIRLLRPPLDHVVLSGLSWPGNFAWDPDRKRLVVPLIGKGQVEVWELRRGVSE